MKNRSGSKRFVAEISLDTSHIMQTENFCTESTNEKL